MSNFSQKLKTLEAEVNSCRALVEQCHLNISNITADTKCAMMDVAKLSDLLLILNSEIDALGAAAIALLKKS